MDKLIENLIRYFAKYPQKEGILEHFKRSAEEYAGYMDLKTYIKSLPDVSVIPELETLIISTNEEIIKQKVNNIKGYFLMIEYGVIPTGEPRSGGVRESKAHISLIVAKKHETQNIDMFEEALESDKMLGILNTIINQMIKDSRDCELLLGFEKSAIQTSPIEPAALHGCYGWWASLEKSSHTMIG